VIKTSIVMKRILNYERKRRIHMHVKIEEELVIAMKKNGKNISDTINIALEKYLKETGLL